MAGRTPEVKIGALRREPSNGLGDGQVFLSPVVAATREDLRFARSERGVHSIPIELDFVKPVGAVRGFLNDGRIWLVNKATEQALHRIALWRGACPFPAVGGIADLR